MDTPPTNRLEEIFAQAVAFPVADRAAWLEVACEGQPELRKQIEELLRSHEAEDFMEGVAHGPGVEAQFARLKPEEPGDRIGNYKLLEQIGEGGFGSVWVADQESPVRRRVALKIIKLGMDTKEVVARFEQERQALAMMDHPNIAKVLDAGATPLGRPFFVMELVRGIKITDYCDQARLSTADRLKLFIAACHAVQHAHQKGIIHRDIKPSNILVTLHDGMPVPKVIDFGVAKATQKQRLSDLTVYTQFEQMIGTPLYMSPEQAEMSGLDIDTRSDIYSLGVLLYELLTGRTPFDPAELMRRGLDEIRRTIREQEPKKPSTALQTMAFEARTTVAEHRQTDAGKLLSLIRGDLDWIVIKALEKDRTRRYETAIELALDIQRHVSNEPVRARPPSRRYRFQKFARRNKSVLAVGGLIAAVLVAAASISTWHAVLTTRANKLAADRLEESERAREEAEAISAFIKEIFQSPDPLRDGRTITVAEKLKTAAQRLDIELANQPARLAKLQGTIGDTFSALGLPRDAIPLHEKSWNYNRTNFGAGHPDSIDAMINLASSYHQAGRREEAIALQEEALKVSRSALGWHGCTLRAMTNLANFYYYAERNKDALKIREELVLIQKRFLGAEHRATLGSITNLAISYAAVDRTQEAILMIEAVLPIKRRVLSARDPYILVAMENLAHLYERVKRSEEAMEIREDVLALSRDILGPEHRTTLGAMINLAKLYGGADHVLEATGLTEEALVIMRRVLPANDPYFALALDNLAKLYERLSRHDDALKANEEILTFRRETEGPEAVRTLIALEKVALSYQALGRWDEALKRREQVILISTKVRGQEDRRTLGAITNVAISYAGLGRVDEAIKLLEDVIPVKRRVLKRNDPFILVATQHLADLYKRANRHEDALKAQESLVALNREINGPQHTQTLESIRYLSTLLMEAERSDDALKLLTENSLLGPTPTPHLPATIRSQTLDPLSRPPDLGTITAERMRELQRMFGAAPKVHWYRKAVASIAAALTVRRIDDAIELARRLASELPEPIAPPENQAEPEAWLATCLLLKAAIKDEEPEITNECVREAQELIHRLQRRKPSLGTSAARVDLLMSYGHWKEASILGREMFDQFPGNPWPIFRYGPLLLKTGDVKAYDKLCEEILVPYASAKPADFEKLDASYQGHSSDIISRVICLQPPSAANLKWAIILADRAMQMEKSPHYLIFVFAKGLALYRERKFSESIELLEPVLSRMGRVTAVGATAVLAMAKYGIGERKAAQDVLLKGEEIFKQSWLDKNRVRIEESVQDWLMADILLREARALIEVEK